MYNLIRQAHPAAYENLMEKAAFEANRSKPKAEKIYELIRGKAETLRKTMEGGKTTP